MIFWIPNNVMHTRVSCQCKKKTWERWQKLLTRETLVNVILTDLQSACYVGSVFADGQSNYLRCYISHYTSSIMGTVCLSHSLLACQLTGVFCISTLSVLACFCFCKFQLSMSDQVKNISPLHLLLFDCWLIMKVSFFFCEYKKLLWSKEEELDTCFHFLHK